MCFWNSHVFTATLQKNTRLVVIPVEFYVQHHLTSCYLCFHGNRVIVYSPGCSRSVSYIYGSQAAMEIRELPKVNGQARKGGIKEEGR